MFPKDREVKTKQSNIIYWFTCGRTECDNEYTGESARTFEERYKKHLKAPSLIFEHQNITGQTTTVENFKIIGREGQNMARTIKEAIYIRANNPTLNRNIGKYNCHTFGIKFCFHPRTKNQINIPQHYSICTLRGLLVIKISAQKHLCLRRFNNNN